MYHFKMIHSDHFRCDSSNRKLVHMRPKAAISDLRSQISTYVAQCAAKMRFFESQISTYAAKGRY